MAMARASESTAGVRAARAFLVKPLTARACADTAIAPWATATLAVPALVCMARPVAEPPYGAKAQLVWEFPARRQVATESASLAQRQERASLASWAVLQQHQDSAYAASINLTALPLRVLATTAWFHPTEPALALAYTARATAGLA